MSKGAKWTYAMLVVSVLSGLSYLLQRPELDEDGKMTFVMLAAATLYGLYWMVQIPGAINQFDKVQKNRPKRMIDGKEHVWLINIVREVTSLRDSRPDEVIADFKSRGLEIVVLEDAWDIWGKEKCPELRSVWGRQSAGSQKRYSDIPC